MESEKRVTRLDKKHVKTFTFFILNSQKLEVNVLTKNRPPYFNTLFRFLIILNII